MKEVRIRIRAYDDRKQVMPIIAENGYKISVRKEEQSSYPFLKIHWLVVEIPDDDMKEV